jgi:hypothetical protein
MPVDPLSSATRTAKRNLMVVSVLSITYRAFNVSVEKIPVAGLSIDFDDRVFIFLLAVSLLWFLLTFSLYYFIDVRNVQPTLHLVGSEKRYADAIGGYIGINESHIVAKLRKAFPTYTFNSTGVGVLLRQIEAGNLYMAEQALGDGNVFSPRSSLQILTWPYGRDHEPDVVQDDASNSRLFIEAARIIRVELRKYKRRFCIYLLLRLPRRYAVRAAYLLRDYGTDGALPVALGIVALLGLFNLIGFGWLQHLTPPK